MAEEETKSDEDLWKLISSSVEELKRRKTKLPISRWLRQVADNWDGLW